MLDSLVEIRGNSIQFSMELETEFCELTPQWKIIFQIIHFGQHTKRDFTTLGRLFAKRQGRNSVAAPAASINYRGFIYLHIFFNIYSPFC